VGIEIPNYELLQPLGRGAMAQVWLAEHKVNRRRAAIKILQRSLLHDEDAEQLFLREGEVLAGFRDENIVAIYDNARVGDYAYIAMEYLAGGTLLERMKRGPISVGESIAFIAQVARALGVAHRAGIIHRDLKPANIMFRNEGTPVLTDFGAARVLERSTIYGKDGGIIGTPVYMSPEQIQGHALDGRCDLYSLGVLFHELLTGELPFRGQHIAEIATQHVLAPVPRLPPAVAMMQPVLDKLLAKQPDERYHDADELVAALRELYLGDEDLRRQVGFSASSAAWSSQLRAMGFVLDTDARSEARRLQAEQLGRTGATPPPLPPATNATQAMSPPAPPLPPAAKTSPPSPPASTSTRPIILAIVSAGGVFFLLVVAALYLAQRSAAPTLADATSGNADAVTTSAGNEAGGAAPASIAATASNVYEPVADAPAGESGAPASGPAPGNGNAVECDADCRFFQQLFASAQSGFAQIRGAPNGTGGYATGATPGEGWSTCELAGESNREVFRCQSVVGMSAETDGAMFARTRAALRAALPAAEVREDAPDLFVIAQGEMSAELQWHAGSEGYLWLEAGRNRNVGY